MVYSTVKPCFVKFLSCLRFELGGLAKRWGECFVVASSPSYLAVGHLADRLHLIATLCGRQQGKEECEQIETPLILYNPPKESCPGKQVRKLWFNMKGEACISYHKTVTWMNLLNLNASFEIRCCLEGERKKNKQIRFNGSCSNCNYIGDIQKVSSLWGTVNVLMLKFFLFLQWISEDVQLDRKRRVPSLPGILDGIHRLASIRTFQS